MMADPKYAGLPGIIYDQADVYETSDLPESEQEFHDAYSEILDSNAAVEVLHISGSDAYEKFKGKSLNTTDVDFSDGIYRKHRTGYLSKPIEWSIGEEGSETVVEKYQRLQCEINQLQQDIQDLKGSIKHVEGNVSASDLAKNVEELRSTLTNLNLEKSLGKDIVSSISDPEVALQRKLLNLMENFKKSGTAAPAKKEKGGLNSSGEQAQGLKYELFYAPEQSKLTDMAQMAQIEKKLDRMEALVGTDADQMSSLSGWTNHKSLLGTVRALGSRLALLEPSHLDHIEGRLHAVHTRMNAIAEKKGAFDDAEKQTKVNELFELVKKNEVMYSVLPDIVDRLSTLENLHHEANQFNASLKQLDAAQAQLTSTQDANSSLLKAVQEKFIENLTAVQENIKALDDRINKIPKPKK